MGALIGITEVVPQKEGESAAEKMSVVSSLSSYSLAGRSIGVTEVYIVSSSSIAHIACLLPPMLRTKNLKLS